jgi:hypothetical protein
MAQSKKNVLKRIDRQCARLNPRVSYAAAQQRNHALSEEFGLIWGDAYELLHELQRVHSGTLERTRHERPPVTYRQVSSVYERLQTFLPQMLSAR